MANHQKPIPQQSPTPDPPEILLAGIAKSDKGYSLVTVRLKGDRIVKREIIETDNYRPYIEERFAVWTALNILDREEGP